MNSGNTHGFSSLVIVCLAPILFAALSCDSYKIAQRVPSVDGHFAAKVTVNRGSPISGPDIYEVTLEEKSVKPKSEEICAMTGNGELSVAWSGASALTVTCHRCARNDLRADVWNWEGVSIAYSFKD